jgi:predicted nucleic acid-binding protein
MARIVVIDSSPLIGLAIVDGLAWLPKLFDVVFLPESVKQEVLPGKAARGEQAIAQAIAAGWLKVWPETIAPQLEIDLDAGETDCINLGLSHVDGILMIMDERAGRAVAKEKGLRVIGTAAIIGLAKKQGLIPSARVVFEVLHTSDFRISAAVINQVLVSVNEKIYPDVFTEQSQGSLSEWNSAADDESYADL